MWAKLIECIPNISEGRRPHVVEEIAGAAAGDGRRVIDVSLDADHHRSVITLVGNPDGLIEGVLHLVRETVKRIDLNEHRGVHPRMGAVDVIPFVPIRGVSVADCVDLSHKVGARIADEFGIPVYLYEKSATSEKRRNLAEIREGEFEGLSEKMAHPEWQPDYGKPPPHPTAGAVAVGTREFLIAYNINLSTSDLSVAKRIAAAVRFSGGGLPCVKALGLPLEKRGIVQVSMNLTNFRRTSLLRTFEQVRREAKRHGVTILGSEIVGTVPRQALYDVAAAALQLEGFSAERVLEEQIEKILCEDRLT